MENSIAWFWTASLRVLAAMAFPFNYNRFVHVRKLLVEKRTGHQQRRCVEPIPAEPCTRQWEQLLKQPIAPTNAGRKRYTQGVKESNILYNQPRADRILLVHMQYTYCMCPTSLTIPYCPNAKPVHSIKSFECRVCVPIPDELLYYSLTCLVRL